MKTLICGAGKMGMAIGHYMKNLGYELAVLDINQSNIELFMYHNGMCKQFYNELNEINVTNPEEKFDIVISALPYYCNPKIASFCIDKNLRYCDLGGSIPISREIKDLAEKTKHNPIMTDLGLAPGWINLLAEKLYQTSNPKSIKMMVGGIPEDLSYNDPLNYMATWNIEGLLNEYQDDCQIIENRTIKFVPGMSKCEEIVINNMQLEAFCTSGASSHSIPTMMERNIENLVYKTIRWKGHCQLIKFLLSSLDKSEITKLLNRATEQHKRDMVILHVVGEYDKVTTTETIQILGNENFTAMQRATAIPISSVADIMAKGYLDYLPYLMYNDIPLNSFKENIEKLELL